MCLNSKTQGLKAAPVLPRSPCCRCIPLSAGMTVLTRLCAQLCVPLGWAANMPACFRKPRSTCWYLDVDVFVSSVIFFLFVLSESQLPENMFITALLLQPGQLNNLCSCYIPAFGFHFFRDFSYPRSKLTKACAWHLDNERKIPSEWNRLDLIWSNTASLVCFLQHWWGATVECGTSSLHPSTSLAGTTMTLSRCRCKAMFWLVYNKSPGYPYSHHAYCF